jgi:hypothetical protein
MPEPSSGTITIRVSGRSQLKYRYNRLQAEIGHRLSSRSPLPQPGIAYARHSLEHHLDNSPWL